MQKSLLNPKRFAGLFSEHYVRDRFAETDVYKKLAPPNEIRKKVNALISGVVKTAHNKNEAQLEEDFIQPLLNALGIHYIVQVNTPAGTADYAFFETEKDRVAADARRDKKYEGAIAIADAKRWERPLDARGGAEPKDKNPNAVPTKQIANYIYETGADWGVLTDGRLWRLYNRNVTPVSQTFFEINLVDAVEDPEDFHLFYALFSGPAFAAKAQEFVLKESESYWAEIGEDLKEKAYRALELLCNGFRKHNGDLEIKDIYEGAVILLYRLLFILYAENKKLLPRDDEAYKRYSLQGILDEVDRGAPETFSETRPMLYDRLRHLFRLIDEGDDSLGVYQYNGGLFKEDGLPFLPANFLADHRVPDRYLAKALKLIAYAEDKKKRVRHRVDYGEIDVRHLGSIYEGLLEFHPQLANDKIELFTDKGERKATGSYYTPEYIVDYIVENTLGPLTEKMASAEEVLGIKVLDPAMGSGHFLVGAVDFIGRRCVERAGEEAEKTEKDYQREAVERCVYGVDLNPLAVELAKLSLWLHTVARDKPLSFLDHHLKLGNSLVGARVADLGELPAKRKKEESSATQNLFVDYLLGIMKGVINEVMGILGRGTENIVDIREKEILHRAAEEHLKPFKAAADTWVSTYFGNDVTADEYNEALANIKHTKDLLALSAVDAALKICHGDEHGVGREFFHWELEFPEVFFDEHGREKDNPGFDAVMGNPPYEVLSVKESKDPDLLPFIKYIKARYTFSSRKLNTYRAFIENNFKIAKESGMQSLIVPLTLLGDDSLLDIREELLSNNTLSRVTVYTEKARVFEGVSQAVTIFVVSKGGKTNNIIYVGPINEHGTNEGPEIILGMDFIEKVTDSYRIPCVSRGHMLLLMRLSSFPKVREWNIAGIHQGEVNMTNNADCLTKSVTPLRLVRGTHIDRYITKDGVPGVFDDWLLPEVVNKSISANKRSDVSKQRVAFQRVKNMVSERRVNATLIPAGVYLNDMTNYIVTADSAYRLAVFNSRIMNWFFKIFSTNNYISAKELENLPWPRLPLPENDEDNENIVKRLINAYEKVGIKGLDFDPRKTNVPQDSLAFLAQQMLDMNAEKQRLAREFLAWLRGEAAGNLDDFKPKKYQEFWNYDFDEFYKWLRKNGEVFGAAAHAKLQAEFEKYKNQVVELDDKIKRTDRLIDDIVYILYGLTEEEIEIVESSFKDKRK